MNFQIVRNKLIERNMEVFTTNDFINIFALRPLSAAVKLTRYKNKGYLTSLKRGVYALADEAPDNFRVANILYSPSYVSLETILSKEGIIPEVAYAITSITTKATREFSNGSIYYKYYRIKIDAYTGYFKENEHLIATPEKALVDYLYFVSQGKKKLNDRINISGLERDKIFYYQKLFSYSKLDNLIGGLIK